MKLIKLTTATLAAVMAFGLATAQASPRERYDARTQTCRVLTFYNSGWVSEGSKLFQESCKSCHHRGNDEGAKFLYSETKSMKGWNRVFAERTPKCYKDGAWAKLSENDIEQLNDYLYRNASNTYDPNDAEDCG